MIFEAIRFAAEAHSGQYRKGTNIPYISHLINVMKILCESNCKEEVIVAGILHDIVEDTPVTIVEIETRFGTEVAFLVRGATETTKLSKIRKESDEENWKERKQHTIDFLTREATCDQLLVSSADKLDNLRSIRDDYNKIGEELWSRFNAGKEEQKWYYSAIAAAIGKRTYEFGEPLKEISDELTIIVRCIFED
jgi:(p)ppGpp synthase/HD superfamily hydrolase